MNFLKDVRLYIAVLFVCVFSLPILHHYHEKQLQKEQGLIFAGFAVGGKEYTNAMLRKCVGFQVDLETGQISREWDRELMERYWRNAPDFCMGALAADALMSVMNEHVENGTPALSPEAIQHIKELNQ